MEFFTIGSASSGNCSYIGTQGTAILIDAGISGKRTVSALNEKDISPEDIDAILVTHEHRDHISCLGVLLRKYNIPVYATQGTIDEILSAPIIGEVDESLFHPIDSKDSFFLGDIKVQAIPTSHDARSPCAFRLEHGDDSVALVTDLGEYDERIISKLQGLSGILIEANHDVRMLETGIYPYHLKKRIASNLGHLSNEDCGKLLSRLLHDDMRWVILGHLSAENNYDKLAKESVSLEIALSDTPYRAGDFPIDVAERKIPSRMYRTGD